MIVAGPNGAGKTTLTGQQFILHEDIVNADEIARSLPSRSIIEAGRHAVAERRRCLKAGKSFVFETTLSGRREFSLIEEARQCGFRIVLHYVCVYSPGLCRLRIDERVRRGEHDIPERDLVRRYVRSLENLPRAIAASDDSFMYDNSTQDGITLIARFAGGSLLEVAPNIPRWAERALQPFLQR